MKKTFLFAICLLLLISCDDSKDVVENEEAQRTVLVYLIADNGGNDLSSFLKTDFKEIVAGIKKVDTKLNNLLVYSEVRGDQPRLIHVRNENGVAVADTIHTYPEQNPLRIDVMSEVVDRVMTHYPAKSYGFVFASHGEGWMRGTVASSRWIGDYRSYYMDIADLCESLSAFPKLDFLLFDACMMQSVEVVYELMDVTQYVISSPTEIPGPGAPYQNVVPAMFASDPAIKVAEAYYDYYEEMYEGRYPWSSGVEWGGGVSISVFDTDYILPLAQETARIIPEYIKNKSAVDVSGILCYDRRSTGNSSFVGYYDLGGFMKKITDGDDYQSWLDVYTAAIPYSKTTAVNYTMHSGSVFSMEGYSGLSTYIPRESATTLNGYYHLLGWYRNAGWIQTGW